MNNVDFAVTQPLPFTYFLLPLTYVKGQGEIFGSKYNNTKGISFSFMYLMTSYLFFVHTVFAYLVDFWFL